MKGALSFACVTSVSPCDNHVHGCLSSFGLLDNRKLLLPVLEAGKSTVKMLADLVCGEGLLPGSQTAAFLLRPHAVGGVRLHAEVFSVRTLVLIMRALPS